MTDAEIQRLYEIASDGETAILDDLRRRAGIVWDHVGCWTNPAADLVCDRCGLPFELLRDRGETLGAPKGYSRDSHT